MSKFVRVASALALTFGLSGCFTSDQALIAEKDSVAPIAAGTYYNDKDEKKTEHPIKVSVAGKATKIVNADNDRAGEYLMRPLRGNYFVAMNLQSRTYAVLEISKDTIVEYGEQSNCDSLVYYAARQDTKISSLGVTRIDGEGDGSKCVFADYAKLQGAFLLLIDQGKIKPEITYTRQ